MSFFAVLFALLIEQLKPLPRTNPIHDALTHWMRWTGRNFDAGQPHHAWVVWSVTVIAPSLLAWLVYLGLMRFNVLAGVKIVHVPFKGGGPAMADVIAGNTQLCVGSLIQVIPHVRSGRLRALAARVEDRRDPTLLARLHDAPALVQIDRQALSAHLVRTVAKHRVLDEGDLSIDLIEHRLATRGPSLALGDHDVPRSEDGPKLGNPAELWPALAFAALYVGVLIAVAFVREHFGEAGVYGVAVIGGLTDVDAITLSTADLTQRGSLTPDVAWRAILLAALSNMVFKAGVAFAVGTRALGLRVATGFAPAIVAGVLAILLWPHGE